MEIGKFEDTKGVLVIRGRKRTENTMTGSRLLCIGPPSTIFQLDGGGQCYWWRKLEQQSR
jgi:hypothetical protein